MLNYGIKENEDYYNELFSIDFKGNKLYLAEIVGGTGTIIRRSMIGEPVPEKQGTLSGWIQYQHNKNFISGFYTGVWVDRLDQTGTNQYREPSDYPEYDKEIDKLRKRDRKRNQLEKVCLEKLTRRQRNGMKDFKDITEIYKEVLGYEPDLENPVTFNEKIQYKN